MAILKKEDLINGKNNIQKFEIKSLQAEVYLRPLTRGEATEIESIRTKSMGKMTRRELEQKTRERGNAESNLSFDINKTTKSQRESELRAVYYSINNPKMGETWTEEEIDESFTKAQFDEIYTIVDEISGISDNPKELTREVEKFPEN